MKIKKLNKVLINGIVLVSIGYTQCIEQKLYELPDVIFEKIESTSDFGPKYKLQIKQPLDHWDSSKGYFYQKVYLVHNDFNKPVVMNTAGYDISRNYIYELTKLLDANQVNVEHRFFGESIPDSIDYNYLNLKQITADLHHINQLFKRLYAGKWVSMGISKGGVTSIFYKYFYPNDVDVSVPYVAPINQEFEDRRIYKFLDTIGNEECRKKLYDTQVKLFEERDEILPLIRFYSIGADFEYTYHTLDQAYELAILEYPFLFWQGGKDCGEIPQGDVSIEDFTEYFLSMDPIELFSDGSIERLAPHYYQSAEEMGYYGYRLDDYLKYIKALPKEKNPHAAFTPNKMKVEFDDSLLKEILNWTKKEGDNIIYIYGANDTWSACAVRPSKKVNSKWYFLEGKHHYNARIRNMRDVEKEDFRKTLEEWLDMEIDPNRFDLLTSK